MLDFGVSRTAGDRMRGSAARVLQKTDRLGSRSTATGMDDLPRSDDHADLNRFPLRPGVARPLPDGLAMMFGGGAGLEACASRTGFGP